jgi:hypothetical protein
MATVVKDFKIKSGLVVEGTTGTINGADILTKKPADQSYIIGLIGGSATPNATPETVVLRDESGSFSAVDVTATGEFIGSLNGNADTATALESGLTLNLSGDATGSVEFVGDEGEVNLTVTLDSSFATEAEVATAKQEAIESAEEFATAADEALYETVTVDIATAKGEAISTASADATTKADAAEESANSYTDDEISELDLALKAYADQAEADAVTSANSYTDGRETAITTAYQAYADQAEVDAKAYADQKVTDLIGGAPGILDTLNELAEAIGDDANFITTIEGQIALKADLSYVNDELSDLNSEAQGFADAAETAANGYTDGKITQEVADRNGAISAAITTEIADRNTAINVAIDQEVIDRDAAITTAVDALTTSVIEEGTNLYFTNQRAIDAVGGTIGDAIDELTTDDIEEGDTNQYYTTTRAKTDAAALLVGATKTNIEITGDENGLTITAENGVTDSDTDDLTEGTTNLYFTEERAVDALQGTDSLFSTVNVNEVALQVASTLGAETAGIQTAYAWDKDDYRSAEFLVKVAYGSHTEISKVLLTLDSSDNIAITEYGIVGTNGSASSISAGVSGTDVQLLVTTANNNSTVTVVGTLLV